MKSIAPVLLLSSLVLTGLLSGCAEEQPPIDRVQPYALAKSHFVGEDLVATDDDPEFWTQATLIDVGYGAPRWPLYLHLRAAYVAHQMADN